MTTGDQLDGAPPAPIQRCARLDEGAHMAALWLRSRKAAFPGIPLPVHTDAEVHEWFTTVVLPTRDVWVADHDGVLIGLLVLHDGWVDQLYLDPMWTGRGIGSALLDQAKAVSSSGLDLWTFVSNTGARRFYERHDFVERERTDGTANEEHAPDIHYRWMP